MKRGTVFGVDKMMLPVESLIELFTLLYLPGQNMNRKTHQRKKRESNKYPWKNKRKRNILIYQFTQITRKRLKYKGQKKNKNKKLGLKEMKNREIVIHLKMVKMLVEIEKETQKPKFKPNRKRWPRGNQEA